MPSALYFSDSFIIFTGGMPRASYGDRHTLSMMQGVQHAVFDFTSRVVDFVTLCNADEHDDIESFGELRLWSYSRNLLMSQTDVIENVIFYVILSFWTQKIA